MLASQQSIIDTYGIEPSSVSQSSVLQIAADMMGEIPIHGMRTQDDDAAFSGWYVWSGGEYQQVPESFDSVVLSDLEPDYRIILPYLVLPVGWHFQLSPKENYVWATE